MKQEYVVTFAVYYTYEVEANNEREAKDLAYESYRLDMRRCGTASWYDDVMIEQCGGTDE